MVEEKYIKNKKCAYCPEIADELTGVCGTRICLRKNFRRELYHEAVMWTSDARPTNIEIPQRYREDKS